tara:strand:- start:35 stop:523 length:489 start_codon:yes stop_codon:yes gene_type:complete
MELNMKFIIEQIAICPENPVAAKKLLSEMGAVDWSEDHVVATGKVFSNPGTNEADLSFNYDLISGKEFEVLNYTNGRNWIDERGDRNVVSHLGMHCTAAELLKWREFFKERFIEVVQEVFTDSHTNPVIAGKRSYNYVIFDTKEILGVDLKFIVRINKNDSV